MFALFARPLRTLSPAIALFMALVVAMPTSAQALGLIRDAETEYLMREFLIRFSGLLAWTQSCENSSGQR